MVKKKLLEDLKNKIRSNEIEVYYQPQYNRNYRLIGFEALFRYRKLNSMEMKVEEIIELLEKQDMIDEFTECVFRMVCKLINKKKREIEKKDIVITINVSVKTFIKKNFLENLEDILLKENIKASNIALEITESEKIEDYKNIERLINESKEFGFNIILDDFGKGYSTLEYLIKLPISTVKIDSIFLKQNISRGKYIELIRNLINICKLLDKRVFMEGIENVDDLEEMEKLKVDYYQGYYFSRAVCFDEAIKMI